MEIQSHKFAHKFNRRDLGNPFTKLCDDIIMFNIFSRLPVDTLLACKLVSPRWYGLITSKYFVDNTHLNDQGTKKLAFSVVRSVQGTQILVIEDVYIKKTLNLVNAVRYDDIFVVGSCNGLMLIRCQIREYRLWELMIYNPIIKEVVPVRESMSLTGPFLNKCACGLVFHELTNEYSIILLEPNLKDLNVTYYLYGLRTKLWRTLLNCHYWPSLNITSVNLSDIVCWCVEHMGLRQLDVDLRELDVGIFGGRAIMVYNLANQTLQIIPHPLHNANINLNFGIVGNPHINLPNSYSRAVGDINGRFVHSECGLDDIVYLSVLDNSISGYSWIKVHVIDLRAKFKHFLSFSKYWGIFKVIHIIDGELILVAESERIFRYNINLNTIQKIHKPRHMVPEMLTWCASATKSFVSLKKILG